MEIVVGGLTHLSVSALGWYFRSKAARRQHPDGYTPPCLEESRGGGTAETQQLSPAEKHPGINSRCEARPHSRPYMAYLIKRHEGKNYRASGFLVSENFVLTAAHCQGEEITVVLGAHNVWEKEPSQQWISVRRQIPHPQYNRDTLENDIMLLQLAWPAELNEFVKTIPLPETGERVKPGTVGSVGGWGGTVAKDSSSGAIVLQEVKMKVLEDKKFSKDKNYTYDPATMLQAENPEKCGYTVKGDSGGPLVCDGKAQGIVSQGSINEIGPETYTRVSAFIDWIQDEMEITSRCEAEPHSRPYMAFLLKRHEGELYTASGFLVSENFVLTAAHCQGDEITVILGAHNILKREKEPSQQWIRVCRQIPHPQYNRDTKENDIMLLQLEKPAELNEFVKTIPLPETGERVKPGTVGSAAGWGGTVAKDSSSGAKVLQEVKMKVLEDKKFSKDKNYTYDPATMLEAEHPEKCGDTVQGDSGGPLVCDGKAQGIVSTVSISGITPGTFTRVSAFINWIQEEMGRLQP